MKTVKDYFSQFYLEIEKYEQGIHVLNNGITEEELTDFEIRYNIYLPFYYREWLKLNNGGELFATPAGTVLKRVRGNEESEFGSYLENNFDPNKRWPQMPNYLFIIAKECTGDAVGFDLRHTNRYDGVIILGDHETGKVSKRWGSLAQWLDYEMEIGKSLVNYDGSESDYFDFLNE